MTINYKSAYSDNNMNMVWDSVYASLLNDIDSISRGLIRKKLDFISHNYPMVESPDFKYEAKTGAHTRKEIFKFNIKEQFKNSEINKAKLNIPESVRDVLFLNELNQILCDAETNLNLNVIGQLIVSGPLWNKSGEVALENTMVDFQKEMTELMTHNVLYSKVMSESLKNASGSCTSTHFRLQLNAAMKLCADYEVTGYSFLEVWHPLSLANPVLGQFYEPYHEWVDRPIRENSSDLKKFRTELKDLLLGRWYSQIKPTKDDVVKAGLAYETIYEGSKTRKMIKLPMKDGLDYSSSVALHRLHDKLAHILWAINDSGDAQTESINMNGSRAHTDDYAELRLDEILNLATSICLRSAPLVFTESVRLSTTLAFLRASYQQGEIEISPDTYACVMCPALMDAVYIASITRLITKLRAISNADKSELDMEVLGSSTMLTSMLGLCDCFLKQFMAYCYKKLDSVSKIVSAMEENFSEFMSEVGQQGVTFDSLVDTVKSWFGEVQQFSSDIIGSNNVEQYFNTLNSESLVSCVAGLPAVEAEALLISSWCSKGSYASMGLHPMKDNNGNDVYRNDLIFYNNMMSKSTVGLIASLPRLGYASDGQRNQLINDLVAINKLSYYDIMNSYNFTSIIDIFQQEDEDVQELYTAYWRPTSKYGEYWEQLNVDWLDVIFALPVAGVIGKMGLIFKVFKKEVKGKSFKEIAKFIKGKGKKGKKLTDAELSKLDDVILNSDKYVIDKYGKLVPDASKISKPKSSVSGDKKLSNEPGSAAEAHISSNPDGSIKVDIKNLDVKKQSVDDQGQYLMDFLDDPKIMNQIDSVVSSKSQIGRAGHTSNARSYYDHIMNGNII